MATVPLFFIGAMSIRPHRDEQRQADRDGACHRPHEQSHAATTRTPKHQETGSGPDVGDDEPCVQQLMVQQYVDC
jgi:hypothetical protein